MAWFRCVLRRLSCIFTFSGGESSGRTRGYLQIRFEREREPGLRHRQRSLPGNSRSQVSAQRPDVVSESAIVDRLLVASLCISEIFFLV